MIKPRHSILKKFKFKFVTLCYNLINITEIQDYLFVIMILYEFAQFFMIILTSFTQIQNNFGLKIISFATNFLLITTSFSNSIISIISVAIICFLEISLSILFIISLSDTKSSISIKISKILSFLFLAFYKIGILPNFLLSTCVIKCYNIQADLCNSTAFISIIIVSLLVYIMTFTFATLYGIFINYNRLKSALPWGQPCNSIYILNSLKLLVFSLIYNMTNVIALSIFLVIIILLGILSLLLRIKNYNFFYSSLVNNLELNKEVIILILLIFKLVFAFLSASISITILLYSIIIIFIILGIFNIYLYEINNEISNIFPHEENSENILSAFYRDYFSKITKLDHKCTDYEVSREISRIYIYSNIFIEDKEKFIAIYEILKDHKQGFNNLKAKESQALKEFVLILLNKLVKVNP